MKHLFSLSLLLFFFLCSGNADAKSHHILVRTPGTLPELVGERQKNKLIGLSVEGALNGTDLRFLREMAGSDYHQQPTEGRLRTLQMHDMEFLPYHVFENVPGLEEIIIDGTLCHVDGTPHLTCPQPNSYSAIAN